jgi:tetratricopeptide (TPR) repeat protein
MGWGQPPTLSPQEVAEQTRRELRGDDDHFAAPRFAPERKDISTAPFQFFSLPSRPIPSRSGPVSVSALRHHAPKDSQKAFAKGQRLSRSGEHQKAAAELEAAVARDPEFADAHKLLGLEYLRLNRFGEAGVSLRRALDLDPYAWDAHHNLAVVLFYAGDRSAAESSIRRSPQLYASNPLGHLLLGYLLFLREETRSDGLEHIRYAARSVPAAKEFLRSVGENH